MLSKVRYGAKYAGFIVHKKQWWRLISPIAIHAGIIHLISNVVIQVFNAFQSYLQNLLRPYLSVSLPFTFLICFSPILSASLPFLSFLLSCPLLSSSLPFPSLPPFPSLLSSPFLIFPSSLPSLLASTLLHFRQITSLFFTFLYFLSPYFSSLFSPFRIISFCINSLFFSTLHFSFSDIY